MEYQPWIGNVLHMLYGAFLILVGMLIEQRASNKRLHVVQIQVSTAADRLLSTVEMLTKAFGRIAERLPVTPKGQ